jgi:uncharacterized protein (DUF1330 family)
MTTYAVAYLTVRDPETFESYRQQASAALAKHGGRVEVAAPQPIRLEGSLAQPGAMALLAFDTPEGAEAWHGDPELTAVHGLRTKGADISIFVIKPGK